MPLLCLMPILIGIGLALAYVAFLITIAVIAAILQLIRFAVMVLAGMGTFTLILITLLIISDVLF